MNSTNPNGGFGCDSFAEELSLFAFGELDGERRDALERHLVDCAACRGERDALVRSLEILKQEGARGAAEPAPQLSAARQSNLLAQAHATLPRQGQVTAWRGWAVAAGLAAVCVGAYVVTRGNHESEARMAANSYVRRFDQDALDSSSMPKVGEPRLAAKNADDRADSHLASELTPLDGRHGEAENKQKDQRKPEGDRGEALRRDSGRFAGSAESAPASPEGANSPATQDLRKLGYLGESKVLAVAPTEPAAQVADPSASPTESKDAAGAASAPRDLLSAAPAPTPKPAEQPAPAPATSAPTNPVGPGAPGTSTPQPEPAKRMLGTGLKKGSGGVSRTTSGAPKPDAKKGEDSSRDSGAIPESVDLVLEEAALAEAQKSAELIARVSTLDSATRDSSIEVLRSLGYLGGEDGDGSGFVRFQNDPYAAAQRLGAAGRAAGLTPEQLGHLLAASMSPAQQLRVQALIAAVLGNQPGQPPRPGLETDRDTVVREFLDRLSRRQSEPPRDMFFRYFGDHSFIPTRIDAKSTFGMDVDTASYALARAYLSRGTLPPKAAVRTEEFVNAFRHDLAPPDSDGLWKGGLARDDDRAPAARAARDVFAIHTEIAPSPFGDDGQYLLQVGLKAREVRRDQRKPVALTFVIDVSGSMEQDGRLELVKKGLHLLLDQLSERDTVGIVTFESTARRVLDPVDATQRDRIFGALDRLRPGGSTNVDQGLRLGYEMALQQLRPNAENRVVLCSDGVANTGVTDAKWLSARIAECKSKYVYLNCVGVGMGNHNDALMEQLADEGDGFCAYVDRIEEAHKLFVEKLTGTLLTVARNAKIQVEFDPAGVRRFRQLGYENRALAHRDFRNDRVDAGEVGAGQEVVALYEVELARGAKDLLAAVRVRYEDPDAGQVREQERRVAVGDLRSTLQSATPRFRLSACVAEFAEILRQSVHAREGSLGAVERLAEPLVDELSGDPDVPEFVALVKQAARLPDLIPPRSGLCRAVDEVKRFHCWREELRDSATEDQLRQLEEQNRRLEQALRDALDRALRGS